MEVKSTTSYGQFKKIKGNRPVVDAHVKKIAQVLLDRNLSDAIPILVNDNMEVIDGQHRLEALKKAKLPVYYLIVKDTKLNDVIMLNSNTKSWSIVNYIQSHIERGNEEYKNLLAFMTVYELPAGLAVEILNGTRVRGLNMVREGYFKVTNYKRAVDIGEFMTKARAKVSKNVKPDVKFLFALLNVYKNNEVEKEKFLDKLTTFGQNVKRQVTITDYLREFESIYNYHMRKTVRFF